jgi:hypothetical protein
VRRRKAEKSEILTSTPYKKMLEEKADQKKKPSTLDFGNSVKSGTKKSAKKKPKVSKPATSTTCVKSDDTQCIVRECFYLL